MGPWIDGSMGNLGPLDLKMKIVGPLDLIIKNLGPLDLIMKILGPLDLILSIIGPLDLILKILGPLDLISAENLLSAPLKIIILAMKLLVSTCRFILMKLLVLVDLSRSRFIS